MEALIVEKIGPFRVGEVAAGDATELITELPDESVDVVVTSPPYWGQRLSDGIGVEKDPRIYVRDLVAVLDHLRPKLKPHGVFWLNMGDSYNTPVNWRASDAEYSSLGSSRDGLNPLNTAYVKPRAKRKAYIATDEDEWLQYGNLLSLPERTVIALQDRGWLLRGRVSWHKANPMPEGRCRRPHRQEEPIYLLAKSERHQFRVSPPVPQVWRFPNEKLEDDLAKHFSRFPVELPRRCIEAFGAADSTTVTVLDPFAGSGSTGIAAVELGCSFVGFEIDPVHAAAASERLLRI